MAAKMGMKLVTACLFSIFVNIFTPVICQTTQPIVSTAGTDAVTTETTTDAVQTTESTTTTTTQPPTTPLPTSPPTQIASVTDIAPCPCDLTGNACDVNCCCDLDCTAADRMVFTGCSVSPTSDDNRYCIQKNILLLENAPFSTNYTQDGLFCIQFDNYKERNFYAAPDLVTDSTTFDNYVNTYGSFSYQSGQTGQSSIANFYKVGDPVRIVYETLAVGNLGLPRSLSSTGCADSPVAYLKNEESTCVRQITVLNNNVCTGTSAFNAMSYYTGFRVVTTPYLFIYIVNGTVITTTPATTVTTTTPTPAVPTGNTTETTSVVSTTTTVTMTTEINITTTVTIETTEPPTTVPPTQINLYNNTYTIDIGLSSVTCRDTTGVQKVCGFPAGTVVAPSYNGATCSNVVKEVEYSITHDSTNGIASVNVSFVLQDINEASLPMSQTFKSSFTGVNDINTTSWSGNPGYVVGKPVRAGIRFVNESFGNRMVIVENGYDLSVVKSTATGDCASDAGNRVQVNFGEEIRSGCLLRINLNTVTTAVEYCKYMQDQINLALEGSNDFINSNPNFNRYVATFGNSEPEQTGDWVPILDYPARDAASATNTLDGVSCALSMGMHIQIVYAYVGSVANRQAKILGVAFKYEDQQFVTYTCSGTTCAPGNSAVDQRFEISQSVSFVDVTEPAIGAVGDPPVFIAKIPNDFFYPFGTGASNSLRFSTVVTVLSFMLVSVVRVCL